jgi:uncharacterized protein involved in type VI secretion and phage assembly
MHRAVQAIRQIARHEIDQRLSVSLGVVKSVHGADDVDKSHACTVELRDSGLVLPKVPIATTLIGAAALPREKDLVVVVFAGGDLHEPIVVGRLYSEDVGPPTHGPGEMVTVLPGDEESPDKRLELRVTTPGDGSRSILLTLDGPVKVELEIKNEGVRIQAQDAVFQLTQSGASDGQAEVTVGESKITLKQSGDISIEASGKLTLKGGQVEISGDTSVKIAGTAIDLN